MRCSPGGTFGPCWGCACPPCLRDMDVYEAVQEQTDASETLMEKVEEFGDAMQQRVDKFKRDCMKDGLEFEEQNCEVSLVHS